MLVSNEATQGIKTEVEVTMTNGLVLYGEMFLRAEQQVLDILNCEDQFVPFEGMDGAVSVINKTAIAKITQYGKAKSENVKIVAFG